MFFSPPWLGWSNLVGTLGPMGMHLPEEGKRKPLAEYGQVWVRALVDAQWASDARLVS